MSATVTAAALRELHRLHSQLADLRGRLDRGPKQVAAHEASVAKLNAELDAAHVAVQQTQKAADQKQLDVRAQEDKINHWRGQLNTASSNVEYKNLEQQIEAGKMAASVLEDETLELLGRVDDLKQAVVKSEENLTAGKGELEKVRAHVQSTSETLRAEVARLEVDLEQAEKCLSGEFLSDYRRVVKSKGAEGLAPAEDGTCQGCGQQITINMQANLALSKPVFCTSCGCLLYVPE